MTTLFPRPSDSEIQANIDRTRAAIEARLVELGAIPKPTAGGRGQNEPQLIAHGGHTVQVVEAQRDPLAFNKHKNQKIARRATTPPRALNRSPPRKATADELAEWNIPTSVSNYVNPRGHVVPLDVRALHGASASRKASVGGGHEALANALEEANKEVREIVAAEARLKRQQAEQEQLREEEALLELQKKQYEQMQLERAAARHGETKQQREDRKARERQLEEERRDAHRRQLKRERVLRKTGVEYVDFGRDINETIALGEDGRAAGPKSVEALYDQRIFESSSTLKATRGADSDDEEYSGPLIPTASSANYTVSRNNLTKEIELQALASGAGKDALVFESGALDDNNGGDDDDADPFDMDDVLAAKRPKL
eukprot:PhM_4_TR13184/c0_g1_i1/m.81814/K06063/SNW1, SKIIP, SKIP; SNW domain-containing protein 1